MATSGELASLYAHILKIPLGTVNFYGQELRKAGMLTTKGRGSSAAHMTVADATRWLLALCAAETAGAAPVVVEALYNIGIEDTYGLLAREVEGQYVRRGLLRTILHGSELNLSSFPLVIGGPGSTRQAARICMDAGFGRAIEELISEHIRLEAWAGESRWVSATLDFEPGGSGVELRYRTFDDDVGVHELTFRFSAAAPRARMPGETEPDASVLVHIRRLDSIAFPFIASCLAGKPISAEG